MSFFELPDGLSGYMIEPYGAQGTLEFPLFPQFLRMSSGIVRWEREGQRYYRPHGTLEERRGKIVLGQLNTIFHATYLDLSLSNFLKVTDVAANGMDLHNLQDDFVGGFKLLACTVSRETDHTIHLIHAMGTASSWSLGGETPESIVERTNNMKYEGP